MSKQDVFNAWEIVQQKQQVEAQREMANQQKRVADELKRQNDIAERNRVRDPEAENAHRQSFDSAYQQDLAKRLAMRQPMIEEIIAANTVISEYLNSIHDDFQSNCEIIANFNADITLHPDKSKKPTDLISLAVRNSELCIAEIEKRAASLANVIKQAGFSRDTEYLQSIGVGDCLRYCTQYVDFGKGILKDYAKLSGYKTPSQQIDKSGCLLAIILIVGVGLLFTHPYYGGAILLICFLYFVGKSIKKSSPTPSP